MSELFLPNTRHKMLDEHGNVSHVWMNFFNDLFTRVGGFVSQTVTEAEASEFDDAGIEEIKADLNRTRQDLSVSPLVQSMSEQLFSMESAMVAMRDELASVTAELDTLRASQARDELAQLRAEIDGLKAGTTL